MALETGTYISDLVATNPTSSDAKSQGDDHIRLLKSTLQATFPNISGAVTPTHTELNYVDGVTSAIQTQLDAKQPLDADLTALAGLSSTGMLARTGAGTAAVRTITAPAAGITVTNGDGVSGNPTLALANDLAALEGLSTAGIVVRTGDGTATTRTITAGAGCTVTYGDGVSGNPTIALTPAVGAGDVLGPASATNGNLCLFDGTTGKLIKEGGAPVLLSGTNSWSGVNTFGKAVHETKTAIGASDIDCSAGSYFTRTISGTTTLTVSNVPSSGTTASFILELTNGGSATVNWFSGVKWAGGSAPTLTTSGVDILGFYTHDGGTTWRGLVLAKDSK